MLSANVTNLTLKTFHSTQDPTKKYEIISTSEPECSSLLVTLANILCLKEQLSLENLEQIDENSLLHLIGKHVAEIMKEDIEQSIERIKNIKLETVLAECRPPQVIPVVPQADQNENGIAENEVKANQNPNILELLGIKLYTKEQLDECAPQHKDDSVQDGTQQTGIATIESQRDTIGITIKDGNKPTTVIERTGTFYILNVQESSIGAIWKMWNDAVTDFDCDMNKIIDAQYTHETEEIIQEVQRNEMEIPPIEQLQDVESEPIHLEQSEKVMDEVIPMDKSEMNETEFVVVEQTTHDTMAKADPVTADQLAIVEEETVPMEQSSVSREELILSEKPVTVEVDIVPRVGSEEIKEIISTGPMITTEIERIPMEQSVTTEEITTSENHVVEEKRIFPTDQSAEERVEVAPVDHSKVEQVEIISNEPTQEITNEIIPTDQPVIDEKDIACGEQLDGGNNEMALIDQPDIIEEEAVIIERNNDMNNDVTPVFGPMNPEVEEITIESYAQPQEIPIEVDVDQFQANDEPLTGEGKEEVYLTAENNEAQLSDDINHNETT